MEQLTDSRYKELKELADMYIRLAEAQKGSGMTDHTIITNALNCLNKLLQYHVV
jgi:hypothetical protein